MTSSLSTSKLFSLPSDEHAAKQVFYGLMVAGLFFLPLTILVYQRFVASLVTLTTKEFFLFFSAIYLLLFLGCSAAAQTASSKLRRKIDKVLPRSAVVVAPAAANSKTPEVVVLARKYWFWQLVNSYLAGMAFSWLGCIFALFIL